MTNFIKTQTSFASGEVAPEFYLRDDINGLSKLENMDVMSGGGLARRAGLTRIANVGTNRRLIAFSADSGENYILALGGGHMYIYNGSTRVQDLVMPWNDTDLAQLQYAQRFGTMIFVHPDYCPRVLKKSNTLFALQTFAFAQNSDGSLVYMPFMRFDDSNGVSITLTANTLGNNYATLTTNMDFWTADNVGGLIFMLDKQWSIHSYIDARTVVAYVSGGYTLQSSPVSDWSECAFGTRRGWPCSITFYQDRLVFGGSRSWPGGLWMSHVGEHGNFDTGTGLDDEAIFVTLLSQERQQICTLVSSDNLQILTNTGEWAISSKPLTPASVDVKQHTSVGSTFSRYIAPQKIEGATVFVAKNQTDIRELDLDNFGETYNATDLCAYAKHIFRNPIDMAFNDEEHRLYVVMQDGRMAVLNQNAALGVSAWGTYTTNGNFKSVAVLDGKTYVITQRQDDYNLERFDSHALSDVDDNAFAVVASGLPIRATGHNAVRVRARKVCVRVMNTKSLFINGVRAVLPNACLADDSDGYTGDVTMNFVGSVRNNTITPVWQIGTTDAKPLNILSVTIYGNYTI